VIAACASISLPGCASAPKIEFATVEQFCERLPQQDYAIEGKTQFDQPWIDDTSVAVTAGCNRERPKPRPAEWDKAAPLPQPKPAIPAPKPKKKLRARLKDLVS
jgi:hypothetical protein